MKDDYLLRNEETHVKVVDFIKNKVKSIKIIDLGCGRGQVVENLKKLGFKNIYYCDTNNKYLKDTKYVDLNKKFPYKDNFFDVVISTEVVEHLENKYNFFRESPIID